MNNMYETLTNLPLFQGVSRNKIMQLMEKTKFHFLKYAANEIIAQKDEECENLKFLLSGKIRLEMSNSTQKIRISEIMTAPNVIAPNHLFGKRTCFFADIYAQNDVSIMQIDKVSFLSILQDEPIFLINLLNILSFRSQNIVENYLLLSTGDITERFTQWVLSLTQHNATDIRITCKQKELYSIFGVQRSTFINCLESLQKAAVLTFDSKEITILDRRQLEDLFRREREDDSNAIFA